MMRNLLGLFCVGMLLCVSPIMAQDAATEEEVKDELEVSVFGGPAIPSGGITEFGDTLGAKTGFQFGASVGYFVTPRVVIGITAAFNQLGIESNNVGDLNHRTASPALYAKYYFFSESDFVPYLKAQAGAEIFNFTTRVYDNDIDRYKFRQLSYTPSFSYGVAAGIHWYTFDNGGLFVELGYRGVMSSDATATYQDQEFRFDKSIGMIDLHAGVNVFFGAD